MYKYIHIYVSIYLYRHTEIHLSIYLPTYLSVYGKGERFLCICSYMICIYLFISLSPCLSVSLHPSVPIYLSFSLSRSRLSVYLARCIPTYLPAHLSTNPSIHLSIYMGVSNNRGPEYGPQNRRALIIRTTQKGAPNFWNPAVPFWVP